MPDRLPTLALTQENLVLRDRERLQRIGALANSGINLDGVGNDEQALVAWLMAHQRNPNTLRAYKRAVGLLSHYLDRHQAIFSDCTRPMASAFLEWLKSDLPVQEGVLTKPATARSIELIMGACKSFYRHMHESGYLKGNPFAIHVVKAKRSNLLTQRFLNQRMLDALFDHISVMDPVEAARWRMILFFMIQAGARRSEATAATRQDLFQDRKGRWWWRVKGKGGTTEDIPIDRLFIDLIAEYDRSRGASNWGDFPLVPSKRGLPITCSGLYAAIKSTLAEAASKLPEDDPDRKGMESASPHWLRHTGLSLYAQSMQLRMVSFMGRHGSIQTTQQYVHDEGDAVHKAVEGYLSKSLKVQQGQTDHTQRESVDVSGR